MLLAVFPPSFADYCTWTVKYKQKYVKMPVLVNTPVNRLGYVLKGTYNAPFTRWNISRLWCPQNVSVKFQLKIPHRLFIIACQICPYLGVSKNTQFLCPFKCKWAAAPGLISRRGQSFNSLRFQCSTTTKLENLMQPKWRLSVTVFSLTLCKPESDTDGETQEKVTTFRMQLDVSEWLVDTFM